MQNEKEVKIRQDLKSSLRYRCRLRASNWRHRRVW